MIGIIPLSGFWAKDEVLHRHRPRAEHRRLHRAAGQPGHHRPLHDPPLHPHLPRRAEGPSRLRPRARGRAADDGAADPAGDPDRRSAASSCSTASARRSASPAASASSSSLERAARSSSSTSDTAVISTVLAGGGCGRRLLRLAAAAPSRHTRPRDVPPDRDAALATATTSMRSTSGCINNIVLGLGGIVAWFDRNVVNDTGVDGSAGAGLLRRLRAEVHRDRQAAELRAGHRRRRGRHRDPVPGARRR